MWGHEGSIFGYRTGAYHLTRHDITIALSINSSSDEEGYAMFGPLVQALLDGRGSNAGSRLESFSSPFRIDKGSLTKMPMPQRG